jgi:hypothetical protein
MNKFDRLIDEVVLKVLDRCCCGKRASNGCDG